MPRPKKVIPSVAKNIQLPSDLVCQVDLLLFDDVEGKIPFAAWQTYISSLIKRDLNRSAKRTEMLETQVELLRKRKELMDSDNPDPVAMEMLEERMRLIGSILRGEI